MDKEEYKRKLNIGMDLSTIIFDDCQEVREVLKNGLEVTLYNNTKGIVTNYLDTTGSFTLNNEVVSHGYHEVIAVVRPSTILWIKEAQDG